MAFGEKKLTPVVRAISWNRRQAGVRRDSINGLGFSVAWLKPVAIVEETARGRRRIPIRSGTSRAVLPLLAMALAVPVILSLLARFVGPRD